jgi:hypothetical protein
VKRLRIGADILNGLAQTVSVAPVNGPCHSPQSVGKPVALRLRRIQRCGYVNNELKRGVKRRRVLGRGAESMSEAPRPLFAWTDKV